MSEKRIKVTDRRMFTPDGELRDIYKDVEKKTSAETPAEDASQEAAKPEPVAAEPPPAAAPEAPAERTPPPDLEPLESGARFHDLVGLLAQSASVYLSQAAQQLENRGELMEMARMHVDLLAILKHKTHGNLKADEQSLLDDALYQLRMAFVQRG